MSFEHIVFITVGVVCFIACIPLAWWFWNSYKYPVSENEIAYSNWFMSWIKKNKATIILLFTIVILFTGISLVSCFSIDFTDKDLHAINVVLN